MLKSNIKQIVNFEGITTHTGAKCQCVGKELQLIYTESKNKNTNSNYLKKIQ